MLISSSHGTWSQGDIHSRLIAITNYSKIHLCELDIYLLYSNDNISEIRFVDIFYSTEIYLSWNYELQLSLIQFTDMHCSKISKMDWGWVVSWIVLWIYIIILQLSLNHLKIHLTWLSLNIIIPEWVKVYRKYQIYLWILKDIFNSIIDIAK